MRINNREIQKFRYVISYCLIILSSFSVCTIIKANSYKSDDGYFNYIYFFNKENLREQKGKWNNYKPLKFHEPGIANFIFDNAKKKVIKNVRNKKNGKLLNEEVDVFEKYAFTKRDSLQFLPKKILDFEFQGAYIEKDGIDFNIIYCLYLNASTKEVIQVIHQYYIGNIFGMYVFMYKDKDQPFKSNMNGLYSILRLNKPLNQTNYLQIKPSIVNGKIKGGTVEEISQPPVLKKRSKQ